MAATLSACQSFGDASEEIYEADTSQDNRVSADSIDAGKKAKEADHQDKPLAEKIRPMPTEMIYELMVAELAVYENDIPAASRNFKKHAAEARDVQIAKRAAVLARFNRDVEGSLQMGELWYELAPDDSKAASNLADLYLRTNTPLKALNLFQQQATQGYTPNYKLLSQLKWKNNKELQEIEKGLVKLTKQVNALHQDPENPEERANAAELLFRTAQVNDKLGHHQQAIDTLSTLSEEDKQSARYYKAIAKYYNQIEEPEKALQQLNLALANDQKNIDLMVLRARTLTLIDEALGNKAYSEILEQHPDNPIALRAHALLSLKFKKIDMAKQSLEKLIDHQRHDDFAHYQLALLAEQNDEPITALHHYERVNGGTFHIDALEGAAAILAGQGQLAQMGQLFKDARKQYPQQTPLFLAFEARIYARHGHSATANTIVNEGLRHFPRNGLLLLEKATLLIDANRIAESETTFLQLLKLYPNNANALNAFGYMLTIHTNRYDEAKRYIDKAITLEPNNPAIIDSLGWVKYKLGDLKEARKNLERAYNEYPDDEVAAHLIELYAVTNKKRALRKLKKRILDNGGWENHPLSADAIEKQGLTRD